MGFRCLWGGAFTRILHFGVQTGTKTSLFNRGLVVYDYGTMLLIATCTSVYKQAQKQPFLNCLCLWGGAFTYILYFGVLTSTKTNLFLVVYCYVWCFFLSHLVLRCTNRHQNKPIPSCLCILGGAYSRILYFDVQPGTKTNLFLVFYVYGVVLFLASYPSMYKQAPNKPIFSCLCLWGGAFTCILYFGVQTGTNTSLFNRGLVVYVYGMVLLTATCTSLYKQAPKQSLFYLYMFMK